MYVRCPACRFVAFVGEGENPVEARKKCRRCGGTMKFMQEAPAEVLHAAPPPRQARVKEEDLDISEPAPQIMSVEEGLAASHWISEIFRKEE